MTCTLSDNTLACPLPDAHETVVFTKIIGSPPTTTTPTKTAATTPTATPLPSSPIWSLEAVRVESWAAKSNWSTGANSLAAGDIGQHVYLSDYVRYGASQRAASVTIAERVTQNGKTVSFQQRHDMVPAGKATRRRYWFPFTPSHAATYAVTGTVFVGSHHQHKSVSFGGRPGGEQVSAVRAAIPQPIHFWGSVSNTISTPGQPPQPEVIRPSRIFLSSDGSWDIEQLHWTGWGTSVAHAEGISSRSNGIPDLAGGKRIKKPAQVTLSSPGPFRGHEVYRCFALTITALSLVNEHFCLKVTGGLAWLAPTPTTTLTAAAPVTSPPVRAVRILVLNQTTCKRNSWEPGHPVVDRSAFGPSCPVTPRLRSWLQTHPEGGGYGNGQAPPNVIGLGGDLICRCQNWDPTSYFRVSANNGSVASVMVLPYGSVTFVVLHTKGGWLVDDTYCTHGNRATTSIYRRPLAVCST